MVTPVERGFTLVELLVVLAALALLLSLAVPRYVEHVDRARETVLRQDLATLRDAIDKFRADRGRFPQDLAELARERYLREVPVDPMTDRAQSWVLVPPGVMAGAQADGGAAGGVFDVRSGAPGTARDGTPYAAW